MRVHRSSAALGLALALCACDRSERPKDDPASTPSLERSAQRAAERAEPADMKAAKARSQAAEAASLEYVTSVQCRECHASEFAAWTGSHHDRAMQRANADTVLGDFDGAIVEQAGARWEFVRRGEAFVVRTEGEDGQLADFEIAYTFGYAPLQQYLVALDDGRMQALTMAWDARSPAQGGQRWFSLFPDERAPPGDVIHWSGRANRWNSMCADCHSTKLEKNFDVETRRYATTWAEIDVACEACHGPGSAHVAWAQAGDGREASLGLALRFGASADDRAEHWVMDPERGIARRELPSESASGAPSVSKASSAPEASSGAAVHGASPGQSAELDACAPCHSRRSKIAEPVPGGPFLDHYRPVRLDEGLYFPDGQIQDEVYVYGSFVQSKMHRAGVRCSDCHDPHSLELRADGDALCARCHAPERFAIREHHGHPPQSKGARCIECHMPARTYMQIDDRRDHSFVIPRPALGAELGMPNPCTACHGGRDANWAEAQIARWRGAPSERPAARARALAAGRRGEAHAEALLRALATDPGEAGIARATALELLQRFASGGAALAAAARDADPLVRASAAASADVLPPSQRVAAIGNLLEDPLRSVRIEAARSLADVPAELLRRSGLRPARDRAVEEYRRAQQRNADDPSAHVNLGLLALTEGDREAAERAYRRAIEVGPYFLPAYVNLADLLRAVGRDEEGGPLLRKAAELDPGSADVQHALGLHLVRRGESERAVRALAKAALLAPDSVRYVYVYGVALSSVGKGEAALEVLEAAQSRHPRDRALLEALVALHRDAGHSARSREFAQRLAELDAAQSAH